MNQFNLKDVRPTNRFKTGIETVTNFVPDRFFVGVVLLCLLMACERRTELLEQATYDGPILMMDSVLTKMSDSARITMVLKAPKQLDFEGGDREWPESLYLDYLSETGQVQSKFRADHVYFNAKEQLYHATGNVVVESIENGDVLNTEELFWSPKDHEFYTERFVTITNEDGVTYGEGLRAPEDFSTYRIFKITGEGNLIEPPR